MRLCAGKGPTLTLMRQRPPHEAYPSRCHSAGYVAGLPFVSGTDAGSSRVHPLCVLRV
jgi:hypothetical protein